MIVPSDLRQWLEQELRRVDPDALAPRHFWTTELQTIDANHQWEVEQQKAS